MIVRPCPLLGDGPHRYFLRLYAVDTVLDVGRDVSKDQVIVAMRGHIIDETELIGVYKR